jgi:hypothetical protein
MFLQTSDFAAYKADSNEAGIDACLCGVENGHPTPMKVDARG